MANKLELTWIGKDEPMNIEPRLLIERPELSNTEKDPETQNMLIHGDNLLALKALLPQYAGKIKCIYIDPPYNTGEAFDEYDDNVEHSVWLQLMRARLNLLWCLLADDGVIFVQLNDDEMNYCKVLMDEVCGRSNFINLIVVKTKNSSGASGGGEDKRLKKNVEFIICYAKPGFDKFNESYSKVELGEYLESMKNSGKSFKYTTVFNDFGKRTYYTTIKDGSGGDIVIYKHSSYSTKSVAKLAREDGITELEVFYKYSDLICTTENAQTSIRTRVREATDEEDNLYSIEYYPISGRNKGKLTTIYFVGKSKRLVSWFKNVTIMQDGVLYKREKTGSLWDTLNWNNVNREGGVAFSGGKKPEVLLEKILELATRPGDLVLDSFLGSGTTSAVAHKMGRKYISIEMGEHAFSHCKYRMDRIISGEDKGGISKNVNWQGGGGYRFYELAPTLIKQDVFGEEVINEEYDADMLAAAVALHEGFIYAPDSKLFWKQSNGSENSYLFVTTRHLNGNYLDSIKDTMENDEYLIIACRSFESGLDKAYENIRVKKIPQMLLDRCEFGKTDYNLNIVHPPVYEDEEDCDEYFFSTIYN
ncbi:MAG: site-specific DNA-methyltransferase [Dorea sp.]|nr:site-specific DNA-methyltransferase [Dorea sp.]